MAPDAAVRPESPGERGFSAGYARLRSAATEVARERPQPVPEDLLQCVWYDRMYRTEGLTTEDGRRLRVVSPGWWNRGEGPDFKGAQIEFNGRLRTGDVEIHVAPQGWRQHGHDGDTRYDDVILHVTLKPSGQRPDPATSSGRPVPSLALEPFLETDIDTLAETVDVESYPHEVEGTIGHCAALMDTYGTEHMTNLLRLAGEWRMLFKARTLRDRAARVGLDQAVYESVMSACGFATFKPQFGTVARHFPYERARQLAQEDGLLLEAALLQVAGLLPDGLDGDAEPPAHLERLRELRRTRLPGLGALALDWRRVGVRPVNYPERRMAGAARVVGRTSREGLVGAIGTVWQEDLKPIERRRRFEALFPGAIGFWARRCTWTGKEMKRATAPLGAGRVRSIIGNVFVPLGIALARDKRDRRLEERVLEFFAALPKEPDNHIQKIMLPRLFGTRPAPRLDFRMQQGLLQMYRDWCEPNPSCRNCSVVRNLARDAPGSE